MECAASHGSTPHNRRVSALKPFCPYTAAANCNCQLSPTRRPPQDAKRRKAEISKLPCHRTISSNHHPKIAEIADLAPFLINPLRLRQSAESRTAGFQPACVAPQTLAGRMPALQFRRQKHDSNGVCRHAAEARSIPVASLPLKWDKRWDRLSVR